MQFDIFTILPDLFPPYLDTSILLRARQRGILNVHVHNIREYAHDKHHTTDDVPYGGGGGMVMKPEPVFEAVETILGFETPQPPPCTIILLTPQGRVFSHSLAQDLSQQSRIALICGRYEGIDERVRQRLATDEISLGDYVLTGGELPALILIDAITRLLPGTLGDPEAAITDSHAGGLLEYPHYTRPPIFRGFDVPEVLLSGDHAKIQKWRREQSLLRTLQRRPDLLTKATLGVEDTQFINEHRLSDTSSNPGTP